MNKKLDNLPDDWTIEDLYPKDMTEAPMITVDSEAYRVALYDPAGPRTHEYALEKARLPSSEVHPDPLAEQILKNRNNK